MRRLSRLIPECGRFVYQHNSPENIQSQGNDLNGFMTVLAAGTESAPQEFESEVERQFHELSLQAARQYQQIYTKRKEYIDANLSDTPEAALAYFIYGVEFPVLKEKSGSDEIAEIYTQMKSIIKAQEIQTKALYEIDTNPEAAMDAMSDEELEAAQDKILSQIQAKSILVKNEIKEIIESKYEVETSFQTKLEAAFPQDQNNIMARHEGGMEFQDPEMRARLEMKNTFLKDINRGIVLSTQTGAEAWARAKDETQGEWKDRFGVYTQLTYEQVVGAQKEATISASARPKIMITSDGYRLELRASGQYEIKDKIDLKAFGAYIMTPDKNLIRAGIAAEIPTKTGNVELGIDLRHKILPGEAPAIWGTIKKKF